MRPVPSKEPPPARSIPPTHQQRQYNNSNNNSSQQHSTHPRPAAAHQPQNGTPPPSIPLPTHLTHPSHNGNPPPPPPPQHLPQRPLRPPLLDPYPRDRPPESRLLSPAEQLHHDPSPTDYATPSFRQRSAVNTNHTLTHHNVTVADEHSTDDELSQRVKGSADADLLEIDEDDKYRKRRKPASKQNGSAFSSRSSSKASSPRSARKAPPFSLLDPTSYSALHFTHGIGLVLLLLLLLMSLSWWSFMSGMPQFSFKPLLLFSRNSAVQPPSLKPRHSVFLDDADQWKKQLCGDKLDAGDAACQGMGAGGVGSEDLLKPIFASMAQLPAPTVDNITLFTVFTPEEDNAGLRHGKGARREEHHTSWLRAMFSWTLQIPNSAHILIFVKDQGHCALLRDLPTEVTCRVTACWDSVYDAPFLRCLLEDANRRAATDLMLYVEDHIVLFDDIVPAITRVASRLAAFFLVGSSTGLSLTVDPELELNVWQHDIEAAMFLDSSNTEKENDHRAHADVDHSHGLHFFGYSRSHLDLSSLSSHILMGGGEYYGHQWEKILVAYLLLLDEVKLVDVTNAVTAVELTHRDPSNRTMDINQYNYISTVNETDIPIMSIGRLENSHFVLIGKCPTCSLKENREADLPLILIRHANAAHQIIVITVNSDYLALAFNWLCRARLLGLTNVVLLAEDRVAYRILRKMDVPVVLRKDAPYKKVAASTGSAEFQETLYLRALFFKEVVGLGFNLILSHLDTIWFEDPLPSFVQAECDMYVQMENGQKADGGLLYVKNSALGNQFVRDYLICEQENWEFITTHGKSRFYYSDDPDMNCVDLISQRLVRRNHLTRCLLDPSRYVSEKSFFDLQSSQHRSIYPAFVHITDAEGVRNKTKVFLEWDLWAVDDTAMVSIPSLRQAHSHGQIQCKVPPAPLPAPSFELMEQMRVVVNILASTEHFALGQTLSHLAAAQYDSAIPIDLRITIHQPEHDSASNTKQYVKTVSVAKDFDWPRSIGSKTVLYLDTHVGPTDRWLDYWVIGEEGEQVFQLALLAGQSVSQQWFVWLKQALANYYFDPFQFQPQLMAIHLMHTFTIVGESPAFRYGSRIPANELNSTTQALFHYQYLPLFGTLFFPNHFNSFLHWYTQQNHTTTIIESPSTPGTLTAQPTSTACVPTMISNSWYRADPIKNWWQWLVRFTFESGWYGLYTNFHSSANKPRALCVDETPLAGQLTVSLVKVLASRELQFPRSQTLKLYDLHFNEYKLDRRVLATRKLLFPPIAVNRKVSRTAQQLLEMAAKEKELEKERSRWAHERGGGGSDMDEEDDGDQGLWALIHNKRRAAELAQIADQQVEEEAISSLAGDGGVDVHDEVEGSVVTPTDLVIDMMKTIMGESDDSSGIMDDGRVSRADAATLAMHQAELQVIAAKMRRVRAGEQHVHSHVRGSQHDRCFVIGDPTVGETTEMITVDSFASLPPVYAQGNSITELYQLIYGNVTSLLPTKPGPVKDPEFRFIVYRPKLLVPLDGHLRGIYFTFLTALVTQRVFLIDLPDFEAMYDCPIPGVKWSYSAFTKYFGPADASYVSSAEIDSKKLTEFLRTKFFNSIYPEQLVFHTEPVSHDRLMFTNVQYKPYALALFETYSRMRRTGMIMKLLQSKAKNGLIQLGKDLQRSLGLTAVKYSLCVHVVAPPAKVKVSTEMDPLPGVSEEHWQCIKSQLISLGFVKEDSVIFFTSNSPQSSSLSVAILQLDRFGRIVTNHLSFDGNLTHWGIGNATIRTSDHVDPLSNSVLYDPYIVNHYVFGDCDVSISSGTTYGIFGAARTGFNKRAYLFKAAAPPVKKNGKLVPSEEKDYCGPMHRIDMPRENDINF